MPLCDIVVSVYADDKMNDLIWRGETAENGNVSFTALESDSYVTTVEGVPSGYSVEKYYSVKSSETVISLSADLKEKDDISDIQFELGDVFYDFTVTDYNGETYKLTELLAEKKAVILNFWFLNCGPCRMEFPYLEEAYKLYSDDIEVLALNPIDGTDKNVAEFADEMGLSFPMGVCGLEWESGMQLTAYPTTVVIDRFGTIAMVHKGYITETEVFSNIFEFFASDDYVQTIVNDISDINYSKENENENT